MTTMRGRYWKSEYNLLRVKWQISGQTTWLLLRSFLSTCRSLAAPRGSGLPRTSVRGNRFAVYHWSLLQLPLCFDCGRLQTSRASRSVIMNSLAVSPSNGLTGGPPSPVKHKVESSDTVVEGASSSSETCCELV